MIEFSRINDRHQTTDQRSSETTKQDSTPHNTHTHLDILHIIFKLVKTKDKENVLKATRGGKKTHCLQGTSIRSIADF